MPGLAMIGACVMEKMAASGAGGVKRRDMTRVRLLLRSQLRSLENWWQALLDALPFFGHAVCFSDMAGARRGGLALEDLRAAWLLLKSGR